jgi:hypothetical protein
MGIPVPEGMTKPTFQLRASLSDLASISRNEFN